jgi:hypothetical protein
MSMPSKRRTWQQRLPIVVTRAAHAVHLDDVADLDRPLHLQDQAADEVVEDVLGAEAEGCGWRCGR